jgi:hypothetical protein
MTALGKMLVFLVLVLSIIWNALVVNAYVTRTNWQAEARRSQAKAKEAADSANAMKTLLDEDRNAGEEAKRALRAERDRLYEQVNQLVKDRQTLTQQIDAAFAAAQGANAQAAIQQSNIDKLQKQVDNLDQQIKEKDKQLTELTLSAQRDRVSTGDAQRDADTQRQRADRLAQKVQQLSDELEEYKRVFGPLPNRGIGRAPSLPQDFRGTVSRTEGTVRDLLAKREVWVEFTPGLDAGLRPGAILTVRRIQGETGKYLGTITVGRANAKDAVGRFTPANLGAIGPDDLPKPGDQLVPSAGH